LHKNNFLFFAKCLKVFLFLSKCIQNVQIKKII
jgi:hypothetical protein